MRTTVEIPDDLMAEALRASHAKTKAQVVMLGLRALINRYKLQQLRELRGHVNLTTKWHDARNR